MTTVKKQTVEELISAELKYNESMKRRIDSEKAKFKVRRQLKRQNYQDFLRLWEICEKLEEQTQNKFNVCEFEDMLSFLQWRCENLHEAVYKLFDLVGIQVTE